MRYFPIFIDAQELNCLVIGAGEVAARKAELLMKTPANISVVAPEVCSTIQRAAAQNRLSVATREFEESDLDNKQLVFVATSDTELNAHIHSLATARDILVNVVDNTPLCKFITPSIIDRSPILIAMSSGGVAPVLLRYLRQKLESWIPQKISLLGKFSEKFRDRVKQRFQSVTERRYFWEDVLDGQVAEQILAGNQSEAEQLFEQKLQQEDGVSSQGEVYLVGAGPGDPELLTFKALRLMQKADVVVYDRLVSQDILELVRRDAEKIYVGKAKNRHTLPQEQINELLASEALKGNRVVRLKGGDPFIFGRGGEEIETLVARNINFQVVPLTHRDHAQSVVFATGHLRDNSIDLNWSALAQKGQTVVFYMGLTGLDIICDNLIKHGMPAETPIALIESATLPSQKVVTGTLTNIQQQAGFGEIKPPTLIVVGTVVNLRETLNWYNHE
jgi:uroporphyrin-III C-methyltransferase/precorrin-2 dehydrogenase/sirohydrochlorin ferrochelatase